jgi:hypothetical protein
MKESDLLTSEVLMILSIPTTVLTLRNFCERSIILLFPAQNHMQLECFPELGKEVCNSQVSLLN